MAWFLGQSIVFILLAFLLGVLVGWVIWGRLSPGSRATRTRSEPEPVSVSMADSTVVDDRRGVESGPPTEPDGVAEREAVAPESAVAAGPDDNLERIEGIGPKIAAALRDADIRTFRQLAGSDDATLRAALQARRLRFAPSLVTWARQAQLLADGDEAGFVGFTRRLVAGRDVGRP